VRFHDKQAGGLPLISAFLTHQALLSGLDDSKVGVVICDRRLRYKALNQSAAEIHNFPIGAHLGHPLHEVLGSLAGKLVPLWETVFATGHPSSNLEVTGQLPKRSGVGRWLNNFFPLKDGNSRVTHVGCFVIEISPPPILTSPLPSLIDEATSVTSDHPSRSNRGQRTLPSPRERQVLRLLAEGKSSKEISSVLGISFRTVGTYRARLILKLGANSIVDLVRYAIRNHITTA
jgi:DNA-binding CsgD family transcriptional regulator